MNPKLEKRYVIIFLLFLLVILISGCINQDSANINENNVQVQNTPKILESQTEQTTIPIESEPFYYKHHDYGILASKANIIKIRGRFHDGFWCELINLGNQGITFSGSNIWLEDNAGFRYYPTQFYYTDSQGKRQKLNNFPNIKLYPGQAENFAFELSQFGNDINYLDQGYVVLSFKGDSNSIMKWQFSRNDRRVYSFEFDDKNDPSYLYDKAIHELPMINRALTYDENNYFLLYKKGIHLYNIGFYPESIETLDNALLKGSTYNGEIWYYLGNSYFSMENYVEAVNAFDNSISLRGPLDAYVQKSVALNLMGKTDEATATISDYLKANPGDNNGFKAYKEITGKEYVCGDPLRC